MERSEHKFKTVNVKGGKAYVEVKDRILYLAEHFNGDYSIATDYQYFPDRKMWVVKATLTLKQGEITSTFTGLAQEIEGGSGVNSTSALENAETSAVGRACAMAGIGVMEAIASADEVNKAQNRAAKAEHAPVVQAPAQAPAPATAQQATTTPAKVNKDVLPEGLLGEIAQKMEHVHSREDLEVLWGTYKDYKGYTNVELLFKNKGEKLKKLEL